MTGTGASDAMDRIKSAKGPGASPKAAWARSPGYVWTITGACSSIAASMTALAISRLQTLKAGKAKGCV